MKRSRRGACCLALLLVGGTAAQETTGSRGYRVGGEVKAPVLESSTEPTFTDQARKARLQGTVVISVVVAADGRPQDPHVVKSLGLGLDESAIDTVRQWSFRPGTRNGQPVAVISNVEVSYRMLLDPREWRVTKAAFDVPAGAAAPELIQADYRRLTGNPAAAQVKVAFEIDPQGAPRNIQVESSTDHQADGRITALVRRWRFRAAKRAGAPVASKATLEFSRGEPRPRPD